MLPVVARLEMSGEATRSIVLYPMIGELGHDLKTLINLPNEYYLTNGHNLWSGCTYGLNDIPEG